VRAGHRLAGVILTDATTGTPLVTGLLACGVALGLGLLTDTGGMLAGWADPMNLTLTAAAFLAPVAAGSANAHATSLVLSGSGDLAATSPRGRSAAYLVSVVSVAAWQVAAYALLAAVVMVRSDSAGAHSPAMLLLGGSALTLILACTGIGAALSIVVPSRVTAPATTLLIFLWVYLFSYAGGPARLLSPIYPEIFYQVYLEPRVRVVGAQILAMAALLAGAAAVLAWRRTRVVLVVVSVLLVAGATVTGLGAGTQATQFRHPPTDPPCRSSHGVRLCVWPESRNRLTEGLQALVSVRGRARRFIELPTDYHEPGLRSGPDSVEYLLPPPGQETFLFDAVLAATPVPACDSSKSLRAVDRIQSWLMSLMSDDATVGDREVRRIRQAPLQEQRAWLADNLRNTRACS